MRNCIASICSIRTAALGIVLLIPFSFLLIACGKKGPPTLKSYEKPTSPSLVRVFHREADIIISWTFPEQRESSISGFIVLRSQGTGLEKIQVRRDLRSYTDTDFAEGKTYRYRIVAKNQKGILSDESNPLEITPLHPPDAPQDFGFELENDSVLLKWKNSGTGIFYNIYKSPDKGVYGTLPLNASPISGTSFRDGISLDTVFYYTVRGLRNSQTGDEGPSSEVVIDPSEFVPPAPKDLGYYAAEDKVFLYWTALPQSWLTGYRIYRRTGNGNFTFIGETQIPTFVDNEAPANKLDYRVTATGPVKEGPPAEIGVVYVPEK